MTKSTHKNANVFMKCELRKFSSGERFHAGKEHDFKMVLNKLTGSEMHLTNLWCIVIALRLFGHTRAAEAFLLFYYKFGSLFGVYRRLNKSDDEFLSSGIYNPIQKHT